MTGRMEIELAGVKIPLLFGMFAVEEFGRRQSIGNIGGSKVWVDLVYAGYYNHEVAVNEKNPTITYGEFTENMHDLILNNDPILVKIWDCFQESKGGSAIMDKVKKKTEEEVISQ